MKSKNLYTIKYVADRTGLKPHAIRAWESRYNAVVPKRTQTNRRLYCQNDIRRLKLLKMAIDAGNQISCIADATIDELEELIEMSRPAADSAYPVAQSVASALGPDHDSLCEEYLKSCKRAVVSLDLDTLEKALSEAAIQLPRKRLVENVIVPLFKHIGDLWSAGRLKIINEHVASNCARSVIWDLLRSNDYRHDAPRIVVGTPVGQWHELGALSAALASAEAGWRPIYVGANLPAEELASATQQFQAQCIALSIHFPQAMHQLRPELSKLRSYIGPQREIFIGGLTGRKGEALAALVNGQVMRSWDDIISSLNGLNDGAG